VQRFFGESAYVRPVLVGHAGHYGAETAIRQIKDRDRKMV
jgi:hypothetical protein